MHSLKESEQIFVFSYEQYLLLTRKQSYQGLKICQLLFAKVSLSSYFSSKNHFQNLFQILMFPLN